MSLNCNYNYVAEEAVREQRRNAIRGQIRTVESWIMSYDEQISSLESKLESQRTMKELFDGKCSELDTEKAAKSVGIENVSKYTSNLKFSLGYTEVMRDLFQGNTSKTYQGYREEISQYMQSEINANQTRLDTLQREKNTNVTTLSDLNRQLTRI